jgi:hypothetical protein
LRDKEGDFFERYATFFKFMARYGGWDTTPSGIEGALDIERGSIASDRRIISQADRMTSEQRAAARDEARRRKTGLAGEAGREMGQADILDQEAGAEAGAPQIGNQVADINQMGRLQSALATARENVKRDQEAILNALLHATGFTAEALKKIEEHAKTLADHEKRVREVEGRPPRTY